MKLIDENKAKVNQLCLEHHVKELYLFGSSLTDKFNEESDIDLLIQFSNVELKDYFNNYMDFKEKMELLFNRNVDLVEDKAIKNPIFRATVDRNKQLIYS